MATKTFVHINGVDYELAAPLDDVQVAQFAELLAIGAQERIDVLRGGEWVSLALQPESIWATGAWTVEETSPQIF